MPGVASRIQESGYARYQDVPQSLVSATPVGGVCGRLALSVLVACLV